MKNKTTATKLLFTSLLFLLMLTYPLLGIANRPDSPGGLFLYIFIVWALFILLLFTLTQSLSEKKRKHE